jgi:hypothetical protein
MTTPMDITVAQQFLQSPLSRDTAYRIAFLLDKKRRKVHSLQVNKLYLQHEVL